MARKARQKISYVLPLANSSGGHRLGVNGLALDPKTSTLYSGGRDGAICAWDTHLSRNPQHSPSPDGQPRPPPATTIRQRVQAHTNWINDIALVQGSDALVSASSDMTVKVWRPAAHDAMPPQTVGLHLDYVKVLAVPDYNDHWVASGGLDRKINLWDLSGSGQKLSIDAGEDEGALGTNKEKGSVYALGVTPNVIASGGPESIVRVWDPKSGRRITKFVGHTDNIRDIMVSDDGERILSASSDQTVKVWSITAGRCMHTLTMHDASVWALWSDDPRLEVFYSSDKSGLVAKTDVRGCFDFDEGLSISLAQEHEGVHQLTCGNGYVWTATSRPSINRWHDVDTTDAEADFPETYKTHRFSVSTTRSRMTSISQHPPTSPPRQSKKLIPLKHVLRLSNAAFFPTQIFSDADTVAERRRGTVQIMDAEVHTTQPMQAVPESFIEGQNGLIKHVTLSDRRRVLTLDTAGEVIMWDILKCVPIKSFGKRHIEDVQPEVSTQESVPNWCSVDTRTGSLTITLEENSCFDAELYADELPEYKDIVFKEDQRINLGKWVLRYLFDGIITAEIQRDQIVRKRLMDAQQQNRLERSNAPLGILLPPVPTHTWDGASSEATPRAGEQLRSPTTPGFAISLATPAIQGVPAVSNTMAGVIHDNPQANGESAGATNGRHSLDYFSSSITPTPGFSPNPMREPPTPAGMSESGAKTPAADDGRDSSEHKDTSSKFGKKFRMNMSFPKMKLGRSSTSDKDKTADDARKDDNDSDTKSNATDDSRQVEDSFMGCVQRIRLEYRDKVQAHAQQQGSTTTTRTTSGSTGGLELETLITPSMPSDTPVLKPPSTTTILIQVDRPEAGGMADLFEGTVGTLAEHVDTIERVAPMWLGEVLLRNVVPEKDVVKISFVLEPWKDTLPAIATEGNNRLNANRMLRARKILAYVAERIEAATGTSANPATNVAETEDLQPEDYLELWCNNQLIAPSMTLATIRAHAWRGGGDVCLYYKANGRKDIRMAPSA